MDNKKFNVIVENWKKFVNEDADPNKIDPKLFPTKLSQVKPELAQSLAYTGKNDGVEKDLDDSIQSKEGASFPASQI